jgi:hypothetical protein
MNRSLISLLALCLAPALGCSAETASSDDAYHTETCAGCAEADYALAITADEGLSADLALVYSAGKDSFSCTDLVWDMLNPKRVPEEYDVEPDPAECSDGPDGQTTCVYAFNDAMGDSCESTVRHMYLRPSNADGSAEAWAYLSLIDAHEDEQVDETQTVSCSEHDGVVNCGNDLLRYDTRGRAHIHLGWAE